eukprot:831167_1
MAYDDKDVNQGKELEQEQGRLQIYQFHFIGTIETYDTLLGIDLATFREEILDLFDIPYDRDLKELTVAKDDEGQEENQYKITCGYFLKTRKDPNKYINEDFEDIVEKDYFQGAVQRGFDLALGPELIRWEGKFRRMHQNDYKMKRKKPDDAKGLTQKEIDEDQQRRELNKERKAKQAKRKSEIQQARDDKQKELVKEYADAHYQYDANNPNYKKKKKKKEKERIQRKEKKKKGKKKK